MPDEVKQVEKTLDTMGTLSNAVAILTAIAIIVVIGVAVRRQRPDAYVPVLVWAICLLATDVVLGFGGPAYARSAEQQGVGGILRAQVHIIAMNMIVGVALNVILMFGILRLARPPKPVVPQGDPPYR